MTEVAVLEQSHDFGCELRRRRTEALLSLEELGRLVHYSKGQLSKVERGLKRPTPELARLCDTQLRAGGALSALVPRQEADRPLPDSGYDGEVWLMRLDQDGSSSFQPVRRRSVIAAGAASVLTMHVEAAGTPDPSGAGADTVVDASRLLFDQFRRIGQASGPAGVLPPLIAQTHALEQLAMRSGSRTRAALLVLASRYAEYTGWMAQELGDDRSALWWTDRAVQLARAGDDPALVAYSWVRRSLLCLYRGQLRESVELSERALNSDAPPRVRGLAAQHLAQGLAAEGSHDACTRSLEQARGLLDRGLSDPVAPVLGASHLPDVVAMFTGWCLYELGRPDEAAQVLDREHARIPEHAMRTRARYGVRRALAHAAAGEIDHACHLTREVLPSVRLTHSATIAADLRRLVHTLGRHPRQASVREIGPELSAALALHSPAPRGHSHA
ncbi:helix-turn-helix domain-containing protein [Streptomyces liangshanensis]|uniref:Helix-turn-helix domain-containing protein n=1 Tax=Streptomyces liangshanensis TaxID=2717324 RepID=A0A6G9H5I0_9ACTN|nr:helix-turn-helix transcriptional regulator [Streptomyces liangshanensis]QIQ05785.1 helix-turn-helix domain-containing protein [Streptomyces liangshanensis]